MTEKEIQQIMQNQKLRKHLAYRDPMWFALIYLRHHFQFPFAPFHKEMFHIIKEQRYELIVAMAFRGSGKSTILNMVTALWSILGEPQKKFAVIVSQTQEQAKNHFSNIKDELMNNELLREDFGPYTEDERDWKKTSMDLVYHESKILSVSWESSIRGIKYKSMRPDLIICDDLEDSSARIDKIKRDILYSRFVSEILPLGSKDTRIIVLGNLICSESLLMRLKSDIENNRQNGIFRAYPIIDNDRRILWPERYDIKEIKKLHKGMPTSVWASEYILKTLNPNKNGEVPPVLFLDLWDELGYEKDVELPRQKPLISQMKKFNIALPNKDLIPFVYYSEDELEYKYNFGNIFLNKMKQ